MAHRPKDKLESVQVNTNFDVLADSRFCGSISFYHPGMNEGRLSARFLLYSLIFYQDLTFIPLVRMIEAFLLWVHLILLYFFEFSLLLAILWQHFFLSPLED